MNYIWKLKVQKVFEENRTIIACLDFMFLINLMLKTVALLH